MEDFEMLFFDIPLRYLSIYVSKQLEVQVWNSGGLSKLELCICESPDDIWVVFKP